MYCLNCGKSLSDEFLFCDNCGARLEKETIMEPEQPAGSAPVTPAEIPQEAGCEGPTDDQQETACETIPAFQQMESQPSEHSQQVDQDPEEADGKKACKTVSSLTWMIINILNIVPFSFSFLFIVTVFGRNIYLFSEGIIDPLSIALMVLAAAYIILIIVWAIGRPKAQSLKNYALAVILTALITVIIIAVWYLIDPEFVKNVLNAFLYYFDIPYEFH